MADAGRKPYDVRQLLLLILATSAVRTGSRLVGSERSTLRGLACVLAKYPMLVGLFVYAFRRLARYPRQVIEYKHAEASASGASFSSSIVTD